MVHANFAVALATMTGSTFDARFMIANPKCSYIHMGREHGARAALKHNADYALFIDSDMSFPSDALSRLLKADKDIIGANYIRRTPPYQSLAMAKGFEKEDVSGVMEVGRLPGGFILVKTDVFRRIPEPWFCVPWAGEDVQGEDYFFSDLAREHGYSLWMDTDLSLEIVHWGEIGFQCTENGKGYQMVSNLNGGAV